MIQLIYEALTAYILACVVGASSLFEPVREYVKRKLPRLKIGNHKHFIECRLCVSFYTALIAVLLFSQNPLHVLPAYGLAYFLATQER